MNQNDGAQEFGIFQDEFPDATNEESRIQVRSATLSNLSG